MSSFDFSFLASVITGFFAIMNPIANTPIFLGLTEDANEAEKKTVAAQAVVTAFVIVAAFVLAGKVIFDLFGLTVASFKITGGLLVFYVGFEMLQSKDSSVHGQPEIHFDQAVAVSPLAIPILAGPGTIVTAMNFAAGSDLLHLGVVLVGFAFMLVLTYAAFVSGQRLVSRVGHNQIVVLGKIMGLIVAVIGTGMVIGGIQLAFPPK